MLRELYVENFALIDKIRLTIPDGLTALSGETGAGKSLIIDAVSLLIGGKASQHMIRESCDSCFIEGVFSPPFPQEITTLFEEDSFFMPDDDLIISREYAKNGRNTCRINCRSVNLMFLRKLGRLLVNIHGQMEHMLLLEDEKQLQLLDNFSGSKLLSKKAEVFELYHEWKKWQTEVKESEDKRLERARKVDDLKFHIEEIEKAGLRPGEEDQLEEERTRLIHGEKLLHASSGAYQFLSSGDAAIDKISMAINSLKEAASIDEKAEVLLNKLNDIYFSLDDISQEISAYGQKIEEDPRHLEEIESRLFLINNLKKKYGSDIQSILSYLEAARIELNRLEEWDINASKTKVKLLQAEKQYYSKAKELSSLRKAAAENLALRISEELKLLYMPQSAFKVGLIENGPSEHGLEKASFMIQSNIGEKYLPVSKIASGGELSRIVLAIKVVLAELEKVPTLIFDEVDSGLGGKALSAVAKRMGMVGKYTQSLCVTHAPLMAAAASHQICIYKEVKDGRTVILSRDLEHEERVHELARMIAGEKTGPATLTQARELLNEN